jgi:hypothetical protein
MAIPFAVAAGTFGRQILKKLYTGQKWVGKKTALGADIAAKKGYHGTSKFITGTSQRTSQGIKWAKKKAKKYPKTAAAIGGAAAWDFLDND